jgi:peptidoglycan/LPS O-acetylase OafA/YrhL
MPIDPHLWTISIEYGASIVLYVTQLGLCWLRTRYRVLSLLCLVFMAHQADRWPNILFFGGFILAELDHRRRALATPSISNSPLSSSKNFDVLWSITYICIFICSLYLGGQPELAVDKAPGWMTLHSLIPKHIRDKKRYWVNWAAILLIWSTSNSSLLQKVFTNRVSQYLGKISFSLYLVHGMVIHTLHYSLIDKLLEAIGSETWLERETAFGVSAMVVTVVLVWGSDVFMRGVDVPSVRFAKWVEGKCKMKVQMEKEEPKWMEGSEVV